MSTAPRRTEGDHMRAWVAFLRAHAVITRQLAHDLDTAGMVPLGTYDVLVQLAEAGGSLRHRELLDRLLLLSQPGLSRRVERLEAAGLVERRADPSDGRGVVVRLSRSGRAALRAAAAIHLSGIHRYFATALSDDRAQMMAEAFETMVGQVHAPEPELTGTDPP